MSGSNTADRLRRATQLWHAYLAIKGERFELAQFLSDPAAEKKTIEVALASGDAKLTGLAQDWLLGAGRAVSVGAAVQSAAANAAQANGPAEAQKPSRYLRGVR